MLQLPRGARDLSLAATNITKNLKSWFDMKNLSEDLARQKRELDALFNKKLPDKIITEAQDLVDNSFRQEQYQDKKSPKWSGRKVDPEKEKSRSERRALLVKSAELIRSIEIARRGNDVVISTDKEYGQVHNEGLKAGRGKGFQMPQRQFMPIPGEAPPFEKEIDTFLDNALDKILG
jgi:phage gpG-like protein